MQDVGRPAVVETTFKHIFVLQKITGRSASDKDAAEITEQAMALMGRGRLDDAIRQFHIAQTIAPQHHQTYSNLGCAYRGKSDDDEALTWFREAHRLAPADEVATLALAFLEEGAGQADEAQWLLVHFLQEVDPNHVNALSQLARLYEKRKQWQRAAGCYRRLEEANPQNDEWQSLLQFCVERGQQAAEAQAPQRVIPGVESPERAPMRGSPDRSQMRASPDWAPMRESLEGSPMRA